MGSDLVNIVPPRTQPIDTPSCVAHWIQVKVEIVRIVSHIRFSIQVGFVPSEPFGPKSLSGMGQGYH